MGLRKPVFIGLGLIAAAAGLFVASRNLSLSMPKSLGYQSATITGIEFDTGRICASSYITVAFQDQNPAKIPVDASFTASVRPKLASPSASIPQPGGLP